MGHAHRIIFQTALLTWAISKSLLFFHAIYNLFTDGNFPLSITITDLLICVYWTLPTLISHFGLLKLQLQRLIRKFRTRNRIWRHLAKRLDHLPRQSFSSDLNPNEHEIRLLRLVSGTQGQVSVQTSIVSLHDRPRYYALSYVWGEQSARYSGR
jgi:hypothetical protein